MNKAIVLYTSASTEAVANYHVRCWSKRGLIDFWLLAKIFEYILGSWVLTLATLWTIRHCWTSLRIWSENYENQSWGLSREHKIWWMYHSSRAQHQIKGFKNREEWATQRVMQWRTNHVRPELAVRGVVAWIPTTRYLCEHICGPKTNHAHTVQMLDQIF